MSELIRMLIEVALFLLGMGCLICAFAKPPIIADKLMREGDPRPLYVALGVTGFICLCEAVTLFGAILITIAFAFFTSPPSQEEEEQEEDGS